MTVMEVIVNDTYKARVFEMSASFNVSDEEPSLELRATLLNINPGYNEKLKKACKTLNDYSLYTARVRLYAETMKLEDAVNRAINECIQEGILAEFLSKNRAEAMKMSIYEYDEEKHMRQTREEGYEDGREAGIKALIQTCQKLSLSKQETIKTILEHFPLSDLEIHDFIEKYWILDKNCAQFCASTSETVKTSIYEYDEEKHMKQTWEEGYEDGLATGIKVLIQTCQDLHLSKQEAEKIVRERFALSDEEAHKLIQKYWISDEG
ncbi:MAG: hypothetical protein HDR20_11410 [Lachnospiraceae bacterium]|nr:hypothetical protein [Lachnospiraceae bacterium]